MTVMKRNSLHAMISRRFTAFGTVFIARSRRFAPDKKAPRTTQPPERCETSSFATSASILLDHLHRFLRQASFFEPFANQPGQRRVAFERFRPIRHAKSSHYRI